MDNESGQQPQDDAAKLRRLAEVGRMASVVAHELRNPLTVVRRLVSQIKNLGASDAGIAKRVTLIEDEIGLAEHHISAVLGFLLEGTFRRDELNLTSCLEATLAEARVPSNVVVHRDFTPDELVVVGDEPRLRDAICKVIRNALDAMPKGGTLLVRTSTDGRKVHATIIDTGAGILPLARDNIFMPFFTTKARGTGLDLSIVQRVLVAHGGAVAFDNEPGKGAAFMLSLPRARVGAA